MDIRKLFSLEGRVALVTGATHGLGMAVATALAGAGATLAVNGHSADRLDKALKTYKNKGIDAKGYLFDVTDEQAVAEGVARIEREVGPIDILVNNAGIIKRIPALEMTLPEWNEVIATDLTSPFLMSRAVAAGMIRRGHGKIVNMCSMMSEVGRSSVTAYAAAQGGLKMLTKNLATEWAKHNIQVNGIGPGYFATEQTAPIRVNGNPFNEFIVSRTPASRWGDPEDLAGAAVFLASRASDFVNGHILYVDGGLLASLGRAATENYNEIAYETDFIGCRIVRADMGVVHAGIGRRGNESDRSGTNLRNGGNSLGKSRIRAAGRRAAGSRGTDARRGYAAVPGRDARRRNAAEPDFPDISDRRRFGKIPDPQRSSGSADTAGIRATGA